ncbi:MAG: hypothetical protein HYT12_03540 [Candidatus Liptonbacteria bacterium]|nr:hypothetical protein [Candidatus Liptonbacteria bacterium]
MAKIVVDVEQKIMAIGAELHAEAESLLMEREGSKRKDTWGLNIYPGKPTEEWLEFDSMVNIKPAHGNRSRKIESEEARSKVAAVVNGLIKI